MEIKNCIHCNIAMTRGIQAHNRWAVKKYCSIKCSIAHKVGENHPMWKGGRPMASCKECGKQFKGHRADPNKFCSLSCRSTHTYKANVAKGVMKHFSNGHKPHNLGKSWSEETRKKISISHLGKPHPRTEQQIINLSKARKGKPIMGLRGEKHWNWQGGKTKEGVKIRESLEYTIWRRKVFERDNYTCQDCGSKCGNGKAIKLQADHIKSFAHHPELRLDIDNGRTLCEPCHRKTPTYGRRSLRNIKT